MSERLSRRFAAFRVTILVPVFNEAPVLPELLARLAAVAAARPTIRFDWLFVDDGSTDGSREWLRALAQRDPRIALIELSRNFGKEAAMSAGFDHATGDAVIVLDADPKKIATAYETVRQTCMACHVAEQVAFINGHPLFRRTAKLNPRG